MWMKAGMSRCAREQVPGWARWKHVNLRRFVYVQLSAMWRHSIGVKGCHWRQYFAFGSPRFPLESLVILDLTLSKSASPLTWRSKVSTNRRREKHKDCERRIDNRLWVQLKHVHPVLPSTNFARASRMFKSGTICFSNRINDCFKRCQDDARRCQASGVPGGFLSGGKSPGRVGGPVDLLGSSSPR